MRFNPLLLLVSTVFFLNCSSSKDTEDSTCESTGEAFVTEVKGPTETTINKDLTLEVSFPVMNGCGEFNKFSETTSGTTTTIEVEAIYKGCICTMNIPTRVVNYTFTSAESGAFTLRFKSSETDFIEKVITVN